MPQPTGFQPGYIQPQPTGYYQPPQQQQQQQQQNGYRQVCHPFPLV